MGCEENRARLLLRAADFVATDTLGSSLATGVKFVLSRVSGLFSEADERKRPSRDDGFTRPFDAGVSPQPARSRESSFALDFSAASATNNRSERVQRAPFVMTPYTLQAVSVSVVRP